MIAQLFCFVQRTRRPFEKASGSQERGVVWLSIATSLNKFDAFQVTRVVLEGPNDSPPFKELSSKTYKRSTGDSEPHSDRDDSLEEHDVLFSNAEQEKNSMKRRRKSRKRKGKGKLWKCEDNP